MTSAQKTILTNYFAGILPFCNKNKVVNLLAGLGYNATNITADLCVKAYEEQGKDFFQPFGRIAQAATDSPKFIAYKKVLTKNARQSVKLSPATGKMSAQEQAQMGLDYLEKFSDLTAKGVDLADSILNKDARYAAAQAELIRAQNEANQQEEKTTNKWLVPVVCVVGVLIVVVGLVVFLGKRQ